MPDGRPKHWGEVWIGEDGEAHFKFHIEGGDFPEARAALIRMIAVMQERLDNERRCPFYTPPPQVGPPDFPGRVGRSLALARVEMSIMAGSVAGARQSVEALIAALMSMPPRRRPVVTALACAVVGYRIFRALTRGGR